MFSFSRLCYPRSAVAFFNMKHFQAKHKVLLSCDNIYETLSSSLLPRDRLLRQSKNGRGAGRVLVLDHKQKVKGVYLPLCCLPHPSNVAGGDSSLGVTVEDYLKAIESLAHGVPTKKSAAAAQATMPTVLVIVSHPQGLAYGIFYADGRPAVPLVNTDLQSDKVSPRSHQQSSAELGTLRMAEVLRSPTAMVEAMEPLLSLLDEHRDAVARCSTFYWIVRDESESLTLNGMLKSEIQANSEQFVRNGVAAASPIVPPSDSHVVSFSDRRWLSLPDTCFDVVISRSLFARDGTTLRRTINPDGLQAILTRGTLLLDYVPRSVKEAAATAAAEKTASPETGAAEAKRG